MRCIINAIVGDKTPKQQSYAAKQERLRNSVEKHFDGTFLSWTAFPNENYDKNEVYNIKAAAFEEAIRQGYTQILWLDAPIVVLQDVNPLFDRIEKDGYIAVKNTNWNCAQTVSDACLEYFKVTRDDAENIPEIATSTIGVNLDHPNGKKLIDTFIQACKDGAAAGSRLHDNQSQDPRFKFHRQDQSVFSLSAHKHGLPHNLTWNSGPMALNPSKVHGGTILSWSSRGNHVLNEHNFTRKKEHESYIYFIGHGGISDVLSEFVTCTKYAIKHKRSLLFEMGNVYTSTDIKSVFDFSNYPIPVYTDKDMIHGLLKGRNLEPPVDLKKYSLNGNLSFIGNKPVKRKTPKSAPLMFDTEKEYPRDTVLLRAAGRKGRPGHELYFFQHVQLNKDILEQYKEFIKKHKIPSTYVAAHLRATDKPLSFEFNIPGMNKPSSNTIKQAGVDAFIEKYAPMQAYIATDNKGLLNQIKKNHPSILHSDAVYKSKRSNNTTRKNGLHRNGRENPQVFIDAIIELIVLAKAKILMPSTGGYTEMAKDLWEHKDVVERLLRN